MCVQPLDLYWIFGLIKCSTDPIIIGLNPARLFLLCVKHLASDTIPIDSLLIALWEISHCCMTFWALQSIKTPGWWYFSHSACLLPSERSWQCWEFHHIADFSNRSIEGRQHGSASAVEVRSFPLLPGQTYFSLITYKWTFLVLSAKYPGVLGSDWADL